ncbi:MAG: hypothetical protein F4X57_08780 [Chloroflexi bacterium]|nr:hypothetical protein [Chloroflexota bacterium]
MASNSDSKGFLSGRIWPLVVAVLMTSLLVFIACLMVWYYLGGGAWRSGVNVMDAGLDAPDTLMLTVASCHGAPRVAMSHETDVDVRVRIIAFSTPLHGGLACADTVNVYLEEPLGDRVVVDTHSGETFRGPLLPFGHAWAKPQPDWKVVEVPGLPGQTGFSLQVPFGWEPGKAQRGDAYVGEVVGDDDIRLTFHYGKGAWNLDPADDPEGDYFVYHEDVGGVEAKLLISIKGGGYTGVYFSDLDGHSLSIVGENLWPPQQQKAMAVFRSVRVSSAETQEAPKHEYSKSDLSVWYESLSSVIWQVPGVWFTDLNESNNRIEIGVQPRREAREKVETAIATAGVPLGAVAIEIGCPKITQWPLDDGPPPDEAFIPAIDFSMEVVDQAPPGETIQLKLKLRNISDGPVSISLGGRPPHDFRVSTPEGVPVWNWKCGRITLSVLDHETLAPGEELEFTGEWEQVDNLAIPVPPGAYIVSGVLELEHPERLVASQPLFITPGHAKSMPPESDNLDPSAEPTAEAVYSWVASIIGGRQLRPLFQQLPADRPVIDSLAHAIESAVPVQTDEHLRSNDRGRYLSLLYGDETKLRVRQVSRCEPWSGSDAKKSFGLRCHGRWIRANDMWWVEGKGIVTPIELSRWWEEMDEYMMPVAKVGIPKKIKSGEPFKITLGNWDNVIDGDSATLNLE